MILLIETCLDSYLIALINKQKVIKYLFKEKLVKKSDALAEDVTQLLNGKVKDLTAVYVTNGPGSFMGVRAGLIFAYTLAQSLKIDFYTASSLQFVSNNQPGKYYIDARSEQSYTITYPKQEIKLVPYQPSSQFNLQKFLKNPGNYLEMFAKTKKPVVNYIKNPKIG